MADIFLPGGITVQVERGGTPREMREVSTPGGIYGGGNPVKGIVPSEQRVYIDAEFTAGREGIVIPVVYGYQKIGGVIVQFAGQYFAMRQYNDEDRREYFPGVWFTICHGKIDIHKIGVKERLVMDYATLPNIIKQEFNDGTETNYPEGLLDANGTPLQFVSKLSGIAHLYLTPPGAIQIGYSFFTGERIPLMQFHVIRELTYSDAPLPANNYNNMNSPASAIYDILTNRQWGCQVSSDNIDDSSFSKVSQFLYAKGYGLQMTLSVPREARTYIKRIEELFNIRCFKTKEGTYKLRAFDQSETVIPKYSMATADFIKFTLSHRQLKKVPNDFRSEFEDINNDGYITQLTYQNESNIEMTGEKRVAKIDLSGMGGSVSIASKRLYEVMLTETWPKSFVSCTTNMKFIEIEPMDVVSITNTEKALTDKKYRVMSIDYSSIDENKLTFFMEEAIENEISGIIAHFSKAGNPLGDQPQYSEPGNLENLTFTKFRSTSTARTNAFADTSKVVVTWGANQQQMGELIQGTDYNIVTSNTKIQLIEPKWSATVEGNSLGELNVDTWEQK